MQRRDFLLTTAAATAASLRAQTPDSAKLSRIAIMSICFNPILKTPARPDDPERTLDILDLPQVIADRYHVHNVELQHSHFLSPEPAYLSEFRARMEKAKSRMTQINLEFGALNISTADPVVRLETIDLTKRWIDHAAVLGCPRVMVNQGTLAPDVRPAAIATLKTLAEYGKPKNVRITMENKDTGGPRPGATWEVVREVIEAAGIYSNPDIGNFPDPEGRAPGLRALFPLCSGSCHCHYSPENYSEADAIRVSKEAGYKGLYTIEAVRSNGPDPYTAVRTILDELLKDI